MLKANSLLTFHFPVISAEKRDFSLISAQKSVTISAP